ncbi:hypothetical protein V5O48_016405 [Marasmius crinis-equi]|uniref:CCHC-type domain-containing protein n=1 Tax=Marasmius crinis-equi TaxID=585013 RepID=A0ABR3ERT2_9AGAR
MNPLLYFNDRERNKALTTPYQQPYQPQQYPWIPHPGLTSWPVSYGPYGFPMTPAPPYQQPGTFTLTPQQANHFNASYGNQASVRFGPVTEASSEMRHSSTGSEPRKSAMKHTDYQLQHVPMTPAPAQYLFAPNNPADPSQVPLPASASTFPRVYDSPQDAVRELAAKCRVFLRRSGSGNLDEMDNLEVIRNIQEIASASDNDLPASLRVFLGQPGSREELSDLYSRSLTPDVSTALSELQGVGYAPPQTHYAAQPFTPQPLVRTLPSDPKARNMAEMINLYQQVTNGSLSMDTYLRIQQQRMAELEEQLQKERMSEMGAYARPVNPMGFTLAQPSVAATPVPSETLRIPSSAKGKAQETSSQAEGHSFVALPLEAEVVPMRGQVKGKDGRRVQEAVVYRSYQVHDVSELIPGSDSESNAPVSGPSTPSRPPAPQQNPTVAPEPQSSRNVDNNPIESDYESAQSSENIEHSQDMVVQDEEGESAQSPISGRVEPGAPEPETSHVPVPQEEISETPADNNPNPTLMQSFHSLRQSAITVRRGSDRFEEIQPTTEKYVPPAVRSLNRSKSDWNNNMSTADTAPTWRRSFQRDPPPHQPQATPVAFSNQPISAPFQASNPLQTPPNLPPQPLQKPGSSHSIGTLKYPELLNPNAQSFVPQYQTPMYSAWASTSGPQPGMPISSGATHPPTRPYSPQQHSTPYPPGATASFATGPPPSRTPSNTTAGWEDSYYIPHRESGSPPSSSSSSSSSNGSRRNNPPHGPPQGPPNPPPSGGEPPSPTSPTGNDFHGQRGPRGHRGHRGERGEQGPRGSPGRDGADAHAARLVAEEAARLHRDNINRESKITLKNPRDFDGSNRAQCRQFLSECVRHFTVKRTIYANDSDKVNFVISFTTGMAANTLQNWVEMESRFGTPNPILHDWSLFVMEFRRFFGVHDEQMYSQAQLDTITQLYSEPFSTFITRFEDVAVLTGFDQLALRWKLLTNMLDSLRDRITYASTLPATYEGVKQRCLEIDGARQAWYEAGLFKKNRFANAQPNQTQKPTYYRRDYQPKDTRPAQANASQANAQAANMPADGKQKYTMFIPKHERNRRFANRLCLRCGGPGHQQRECENEPNPHPPEDVAKARVGFTTNEGETEDEMVIYELIDGEDERELNEDEVAEESEN